MSTADQRREDARRRNGEFGNQEHTAPELTLGTGLDLSSHTPVDIDNKLADLYEERAAILAPIQWREDDVIRKRRDLERVESEGEKYEGQLDYLTRVADEAEAKVAEIWQAADEKAWEAAPYEGEFKARGGWTRAFLVQGANGHVHSSMHCSTCNRDGKQTSFAWMTDYSGAGESQIVEDAGERACTVCYPDAPVNVLNRPTKMFGPDEKRQQEERAARAAAKVERDRKRIENALTPDGSELVVYTEPEEGGRRRYPERFKTERAAVIWATDHFAWTRPGDHQPERQAARDAAVRQIAEAIAVKHGRPVEYVLGELRIKGEAKEKRITARQAKEQLAALAAEHGIGG